MKKVSFFLSALALVAFAACNNTAEEAVVTDTVDTTVAPVATDEDTTAAPAPAAEGDAAPEGEADPAQGE